MDNSERNIDAFFNVPLGEAYEAWARKKNGGDPAPEAPTTVDTTTVDPTDIESDMAAPSPEVTPRKQKHTAIGEKIKAYLADCKDYRVSTRKIRVDLGLTDIPPKGKLWGRVLKYIDRHITDWEKEDRSLVRKKPAPVAEEEESQKTRWTVRDIDPTAVEAMKGLADATGLPYGVLVSKAILAYAEAPAPQDEESGDETSISATGAKFPSWIRPLGVYVGENAITIELNRDNALLLATHLLAIAHDKSGGFNGAFTIICDNDRVTVIREKE